MGFVQVVNNIHEKIPDVEAEETHAYHASRENLI